MEQVNENVNSSGDVAMVVDKDITDNEDESGSNNGTATNSGSDGENSNNQDIKIEKLNTDNENEEEEEEEEEDVIKENQEASPKDQLPQYTSQSLLVNNSSQYETNYNVQQYNQYQQQNHIQVNNNHHQQPIQHSSHQPSLMYDANYFNTIQNYTTTNDTVIPNNLFQSNSIGNHHHNNNLHQPPIQFHNNNINQQQQQNHHFNHHQFQTPIVHNPFSQNHNINSNLDSSQLFNNNNYNNRQQVVQQTQPNKPKPQISKKRNSGTRSQQQYSNQLFLIGNNNNNNNHNNNNVNFNEELIFNWYQSILKNIIIDESHFKIENTFNRETGYTIFKQLFINHFGEIDQLEDDTIDYIKLHIEILDELTGLTKFHFDSTDNFYNNYIRIINGYALIPAKDSGATIKARPKKGAKLSKESKEILENWIKNHIAHPYPTNEEKENLQKITGLTPNQVSNWFINTRRRKVPTLCDEAGMVINNQPLSPSQFNQFNQFNQLNNINNNNTTTTTTTTTTSTKSNNNNIQFNDNNDENEEEEEEDDD